jgi:hypothetical protein
MGVRDMHVTSAVVPLERVERTILSLRGQRVILDADLASLYGVTTKRLNEQVRRNEDRFPGDFMFQLTPEEKSEVVANCDHLSRMKFSSTLPFAFTEHGAIMAASVLNTPRAVEIGLFVVRAFVKLRETLSSHRELERKFSDLENQLRNHDEKIQVIIEAIRQLMETPESPAKKLGFDLSGPHRTNENE